MSETYYFQTQKKKKQKIPFLMWICYKSKKKIIYNTQTKTKLNMIFSRIAYHFCFFFLIFFEILQNDLAKIEI